ncbi:hypothetical protein baBA2_000983 (plasmid) [Borrelia anserina]|uniref:Cytosolic protein n=3 Tax=Borrelia anserina TaxID=143 RepID=W5SPW7_BORAN|nr:hypothetical protein [Borrelia anserina]AHH08945.1 Hypothetical protein BAN_0005800 [Borrelia anserina BA2]APR65389.1 hypothetical protein N187_A70 [Borrelia anserina Es]UPA07352.1 hypothetical protein baBA2_000983 [Borrelia anserina]
MVKVKVKNYILFFLLLSLGCNNTGSDKSKDSTFDISKTSFVGKRLGKGINLSRKGVVEVDVGKSDLKKGTGENSVVKVDIGSKKVDAELEDDIELKIQNLLDEFKLSAQQRAIIMDLKDVLTNPDIGSDEGYRTYSREEFYDLFNHTGNVNADLAFKLNFVNSVTQNILPTFQEQKEAKEAVGNLVEYVKNRVYWVGGQDLAERFTLKMKEYQLVLKKIFNLDRNIHNHGFLLSDLYGHCDLATDWFREIQKEAIRIVELMKLREERKPVINYMESVLVDHPDIAKGYRNYTKEEFDNLLVEFGAVKLKEIFNMLQVIVETEVAIDNISSRALRRKLERRFNDYKNRYSECLQETFDGSNVDDIYDNILRSHSNYLADIAKLKEEVPLIEEGLNKALVLLNDLRDIIKYMLLIVRDNFDIDFVKFTCNFYFMLGNMDFKNIEEIAEDVEYIFDLKDEVERSISTVDDEDFREELESKIDQCESEYSKELSKYLYDNVYKNNNIALPSSIDSIRNGLKAIRDSYEGQLFSIKSQALGFISFQGFVKELSEDDLEVIDYMRSLVTNSKTNNYNINEFNCVMGMVESINGLRDILRPHLAVFKAQKEAESAIDNIKEVASQARLRRRFDEVIVKYKALLSNIFVKRDLYSIYHSNAYQDDVSKLAIDLNEIIDAAKSL